MSGGSHRAGLVVSKKEEGEKRGKNCLLGHAKCLILLANQILRIIENLTTGFHGLGRGGHPQTRSLIVSSSGGRRGS